MKRAYRSIACFLGLALALGCEDRTPPVPAEQAVRPAKIFVVEDASKFIELEFVGRVQALQTVEVSFEVGGILKDLPILEGQTVTKGALLAALEPKDFELAVKEAEVQVKIARQDLDRKQEVLKQKGIARSVVDDARAMYELQLVRLNQARERLAKSRLLSPFEGYVARRYVDNFTNISPGANVVRLHDMTRLLIVANVPEILVARFSADQAAEIYAAFDFLPDRRFPLEVYENRGDADGVAQTYQVAMAMDNPEDVNLLPGMTAVVKSSVRDPASETAIYVPPNTLVTDADNSFFVWRYTAATEPVEKVPVTVGPPEARGIPVQSGLQAGDKIVASGAANVQAGMRITPLSER